MRKLIILLTFSTLFLTACVETNTIIPKGNGNYDVECVFDYWYKHWEEYGYPDDIGGQFRDGGKIGIKVVNPSSARIKELYEIFGN